MLPLLSDHMVIIVEEEGLRVSLARVLEGIDDEVVVHGLEPQGLAHERFPRLGGSIEIVLDCLVDDVPGIYSRVVVVSTDALHHSENVILHHGIQRLVSPCSFL